VSISGAPPRRRPPPRVVAPSRRERQPACKHNRTSETVSSMGAREPGVTASGHLSRGEEISSKTGDQPIGEGRGRRTLTREVAKLLVQAQILKSSKNRRMPLVLAEVQECQVHRSCACPGDRPGAHRACLGFGQAKLRSLQVTVPASEQADVRQGAGSCSCRVARSALEQPAPANPTPSLRPPIPPIPLQIDCHPERRARVALRFPE